MKKGRKNLKRLIDQISDLPSLPAVVPRLLTALKNPKTSAAEVEKILLSDPALTAKVLKLINSAYYGLNRKIESVKDAIVYLGFGTVRNLALGTSVIYLTGKKTKPSSEKENPMYEFDMIGLWKKAIATGIAAETTARRLRYPKTDDAMIAGLLHILGTLILRIYFRKDLNEIVEYAHENRCSILKAEKEILGVVDPEIAGWLGENWDLPRPIIHGIRYYSHPLDAPEEHRMIPMLVNVGEKIVRAKNIGWTGDNIGISIQTEVFDRLNLDKNEFQIIIRQFDRDLEDASEFMKLAEELEVAS